MLCVQSDDLKPNTWCQKMPRKICAPDNCNMIQVAAVLYMAVWLYGYLTVP